MKLRNKAIATALSLVPLGQLLIIGTGATLTSAAVILSFPQRINAESPEFYLNRGMARFSSGDYSNAITDFSKVIEMNPRYIDVYNTRGIAMFRSGNYLEAISDLNKVIEGNP